MIFGKKSFDFIRGLNQRLKSARLKSANPDRGDYVWERTKLSLDKISPSYDKIHPAWLHVKFQCELRFNPGMQVISEARHAVVYTYTDYKLTIATI